MSTQLKIRRIRPEFVESVPDEPEDGVLYISERFRLCSHRCCCGCGQEVITPLSTAEWMLTRQGELVSLWPSVGNWDYACRSHYFIRRNQIIAAGPMTEKQIANVRQRDADDLTRMVAATNAAKRTGVFCDTQSDASWVVRAGRRVCALWFKVIGR